MVPNLVKCDVRWEKIEQVIKGKGRRSGRHRCLLAMLDGDID
jgi:hypothetical protein